MVNSKWENMMHSCRALVCMMLDQILGRKYCLFVERHDTTTEPDSEKDKREDITIGGTSSIYNKHSLKAGVVK
ncbi:MAG: hypothetical protein WA667_02320 [Candidatus Nitrosopolaris sp.]